jgi:NADPH:quinone reductase-like Zn-dependent oxidoreductase
MEEKKPLRSVKISQREDPRRGGASGCHSRVAGLYVAGDEAHTRRSHVFPLLLVDGAMLAAAVVISGIGGLGHVAVQYAKAMGMHVAAVDASDEKLTLARDLGAEITVNTTTTDPADELQRLIGGAHGVLITAVSLAAFRQGIGMLRRGDTCALVGLPPGIFRSLLHRYCSQ